MFCNGEKRIYKWKKTNVYKHIWFLVISWYIYTYDSSYKHIMNNSKNHLLKVFYFEIENIVY